MFSMVMSYLDHYLHVGSDASVNKPTAKLQHVHLTVPKTWKLQYCSFDHHFRLYLLWNSMLFYAGSNFIYVCQNYPLWEKVWLYYIACRSSFLSLLSTGFKDPSSHPAYLLSWLHLEAILSDWCTILNLYESRACMSPVSSSHNEPW